MGLSIKPSDATLGAYISGVKLSELSDSEFEQIYTAFLRHALLIFPQQHLSNDEQLAFAQRFGDIEILVKGLKTIPVSNKSDHKEAYGTAEFRTKLLKGNEGWHTDSSYMPLSAKASVLSAHVLPSAGGETEWADMRDAYDHLDDELKQEIADYEAYHSYFHSQAKVGHKVEVGAAYGFFPGEPPLHRLVKVHPETNRSALFIGRHIKNIVGMSEEQTEQLVAELTSFACQPPRVLIHSWSVGDIVVWDNRCLLHRARPYDTSQTRVMMHTRISGDPSTESALNAARVG
ncbi:MAG: TauD/TfdA family dioxygenase [Pseudomonadota bacterium]